MVRRKAILLGEFNDFQFKVFGEILSVGLPHWVFEMYPTAEEWVNSHHHDSIEHIAAWAGTDEIHFHSLHPEYPCFLECTLLGSEEGPGYFFTDWASQKIK